MSKHEITIPFHLMSTSPLLSLIIPIIISTYCCTPTVQTPLHSRAMLPSMHLALTTANDGQRERTRTAPKLELRLTE